MLRTNNNIIVITIVRELVLGRLVSGSVWRTDGVYTWPSPSKYPSGHRSRISRQYCSRPIERAKRATAFDRPTGVTESGGRTPVSNFHPSSYRRVAARRPRTIPSMARNDVWTVDDSVNADVARRPSAREPRLWNSISRL